MNTLHELHKNRRLGQYLTQLRDLPVKHIADMYRTGKLHKVLAAAGEPAMAYAERDAISFYMQNHAMALVQQKFMEFEPLGEEVASLVREYHRTITIKTLRMVVYLLLICTRESRHLHTSHRPQLHAKHPKLAKFHSSLPSSSDGAANHFRDNVPENVTCGEYGKFLVDAFSNGGYGGGYGGKKWAQVATPLRDFLLGDITAEMLMDTAFTLAHNNGPIFNKGMLFNMYDHGEVIKILDVQRAGMIPQLVAFGHSKHVTVENQTYQKRAEKVLGPAFGGDVDWAQVKALGSHGSYEHLIKKSSSKALSKVDAWKAKQAEIAAAKLKAEQEAIAAMELAEKQKNYIEVFPDVWVKKVNRKEAA